MLKNLMGRLAKPKSYEAQRGSLENDNTKERLRLAKRADTRPEILYYLADDNVPEVRRAIASNPSTPPQADAKLAQDGDDDVRYHLADKIGQLVPEMSAIQREKVEELTITVLRELAADQLPKIRAIVSEHLKNADNVPKDIVLQLAKDLEVIVAAPILQFSPLLSDQDLLAIIEAGRESGALSAIAKRQALGGDVADAVAQTLDPKAIGSLLANDSAQLREDTLDWIIDNAAAVEPWHKPLVKWPSLSDSAVRRIAGFVATSLIETLCNRNDIDANTAIELAKVVKKEIGPDTALDPLPRTEDVDDGPVKNDNGGKDWATKLFKDGGLDDDALQDAITAGDREFVIHGLSLKSGYATKLVDQVLTVAKPETVTALAWKAEFSMRTAMQLQLRIARVRPQSILNARNGVDYPLTEAQLEKELNKIK
ncbi:MAG: DUF2336 domain-containing protein [Rhodospirillaceae bacterium]|jgi:hypothetical protein|nr:DUF2336 domain-containing protein [Rhodospirillaceae bacterium]MBT4046650.1 DUF2336 domain-containing protein [Rhodospirillaceae bacterium]MBT4686697.1 DUF2336 domain-containing protein [Rhodospirillaceae bacterium]MBT5079511.1 DUF2336 domain-containing protein [Rhodospirillaceae bacterium]MBT5523100.1 DUF2336 domain-containing protein [Rhodospirillaceae bacterium]